HACWVLPWNPAATATARPPEEPAIPAALAPRVEAADRFLTAEMDHWTRGTVIFDEYQSGAAGFYPANWFGDVEGLRVDERHTEGSFAGASNFRVVYQPTPHPPERFAGIAWVYPDKNWGEVPGRDLSGATRLSGWIRSPDGPTWVSLEIGRIDLPAGL